MASAFLKLILSRTQQQAVAPPVCVTLPSIEASDFRVGVAMTGLSGAWVGAQLLTFQWYMDGEPVPGATSAAYTPMPADEGKVPTFEVTGINASPQSPTVAVSEDGDPIAEEIPQDPILPAAVTARFLPSTPGGFGGHRCGYGGAGYLKVTGAAATYVKFDDINELVPVGSFNSAAPGWTPGSNYSGTITEYSDAGMTVPTGRTSVLTLAVASTPGITVTWRAGSAANNDTSSTFQLRTAYGKNSALGWRIEVRDGAVINPDGLDCRMRSAYSAAQVAARAASFTGENHVVIRPETPVTGAAHITRLKFDGQKLHRCDYIRVQYFGSGLIAGMNGGVIDSNIAVFGETDGADHIDIWDCDISSTPNSEYGSDQFAGINTTGAARRWRVRNNKVHDVAKGIYLQNSAYKRDWSTLASLPTGQSDHHDSADAYHEITANEVYRVSIDEINVTNATGARIVGNWLYDKKTGVTPWDALSAANKLTRNSPYDTSVQPHGDAIPCDYKSCQYGSVDGVIIWGNYISRGEGRDSMPFYTSPPYPNPDSKGYTPNAAAVYNSSQGVFLANNDPESAARGWDGVSGSGTGYPTILKNPQVVGNCYSRDMVNAITMSYVENPIIENNTCLAVKYVPTANFISAAGRVSCWNISGTQGRIRRNISNGPSIATSLEAGASLASFGENIFHSYGATSGDTSYGAIWNDPQDGPALRSIDDWLAHYRAKAGGPADATNTIGAISKTGEPLRQYAA